jgi:hypothetical protein
VVKYKYKIILKGMPALEIADLLEVQGDASHGLRPYMTLKT